MPGFLNTVDHKRIGVRYLVTAFVFFLLGGVQALLMRAQLAGPNGQVLDPETYNAVFTMHGTTMIFLFNTPIIAAFRQLPRAAADRRAGHGVPADERA